MILVERHAQLGGQVLTAAQAPGRGEFAGIVHWLERQLRKLDVDIRLGVEASPNDVLALGGEVTILATGALPRMPNARIAPGTRLLTVTDVLDDHITPSRHVHMIVEDPHMAGPTTADFLAARGHAVTILTPSYTVGEALDDTLKPIILERLLAQEFPIQPKHDVENQLTQLRGQAVKLVPHDEPNPKVTLPSDLPYIEWLLSKQE